MEISVEWGWVDEEKATKYSSCPLASRAIPALLTGGEVSSQEGLLELSASTLKLLEHRVAITKYNLCSHAPATMTAVLEWNPALLYLPASHSSYKPQVRHQLVVTSFIITRVCS